MGRMNGTVTTAVTTRKKGRRNGTVTSAVGGDRGEGGAKRSGRGYIAVVVLDANQSITC